MRDCKKLDIRLGSRWFLPLAGSSAILPAGVRRPGAFSAVSVRRVCFADRKLIPGFALLHGHLR
jgi:hypothetical protein